MTTAHRASIDALIEHYATGTAAVEQAWAAVPAEAADRVPEPGEWSPRRIVHHLADSEATSYIRLRRLLVEDDCVIQGYDERAFADQLGYDDRPVETSLAVLAAVRAASLELLRTLPGEAFERTGTHTESGPYSVRRWLEVYADHPHDHADQIRRAAGL